MKKIYSLFITTSVFVFASGSISTIQASSTGKHNVNGTGLSARETYTPLLPINYLNNLAIFDMKCDEMIELEKTKQESNERRLRFYPNESTSVHIAAITKGGSISIPSFGALSKKGDSYLITVDYVKYRTDHIDSVAFISGVGTRLQIRVTTKKAGISLGNIFGLSLSAKSGELIGNMEYGSLGISGPEISALSKLPTSLSPEAISSVIQSMAATKARMYDTKTRIWPQVIGVVGTTKEEARKIIRDKLTTEPKCETQSMQ